MLAQANVDAINAIVAAAPNGLSRQQADIVARLSQSSRDAE